MAKRPFNRDPRKPVEPQNRINEQIRVPEIRLVGDNLEEVSSIIGQEVATGVYPTRKVREWAERAELDLVEISPNANPPVVRIVDYNKFLYEKKKKEKEIKAKAAKTVIKEIRFGPNTEGRAIVFKDRGELLLLKLIKEVEDLGGAEYLPKMEGRRMHIVLSPKKGGK